MKRLRLLLLIGFWLAVTLGALAVASAQTASSAVAGTAPPVVRFSLPPGYHASDIQVRLEATVPQAEIRYTLDGSEPTQTSGLLYTSAIPLTAEPPETAVIRARAFTPDGLAGPISDASYFVGFPPGLSLLSLIVDRDDLWDAERGIYANPLNRGPEWERPTHITFVPDDRSTGFQMNAGLRIHGGWSRGNDKKSLRLYFRQEYGGSYLEYPLFPTADLQRFKRLILHAGGQDSSQVPTNWTELRNPLSNALLLEMGGYATNSVPVLLFLNGEPWGVYYLRERIDEHFLAGKYDIETADLLDSPEQILHEPIVAGDRVHWDHLTAYLLAHDLADPANYAYVQTQVDIDNLIDYTLLQMYAANGDWPFHNVHQFRPRTQGGRWHWLLWDADHTFGYTPTSSVENDMIAVALQETHPHTTNQHTLLLRSLLQNPTFKIQFLQRTADLLNTTLSPEAVQAHLDRLAAELAPGVDFELGRWNGGGTNWADNVAAMHRFAEERPFYLRQNLVERFGLPGTAVLTFNPPADGGGQIAVNGALLPELPWQGVYFQTTVVRVTAVPDPGFQFAGWAENSLPPTAELSLTVGTDQTVTPRFSPIATGQPPVHALRFSQVVVDGPQAGQPAIEGDWFDLLVLADTADLRGWRVTDNDSKTASDEGSLRLADVPALASLPQGTTVRIIASATAANDGRFPTDDLDSSDGLIVLYVGNQHLNTAADPWFNLGPNDNLALLAPGPTPQWDDDLVIAYAVTGRGQTPEAFGALVDGVFTAVPSPENP
jgi:hypothetical protein